MIIAVAREKFVRKVFAVPWENIAIKVGSVLNDDIIHTNMSKMRFAEN